MRNAVSDVGRLNCSSFFNGTKQEAEGTATHHRSLPPPAVPALAVLTPKMASQASSAANETIATFDLTHKRDKSNIIYQKPIKNRHPDKIKFAFSNI
jgi:hypothetical protein